MDKWLSSSPAGSAQQKSSPSQSRMPAQSSQKRKPDDGSDNENDVPSKIQKNACSTNPTRQSDTTPTSPAGAKDLASLAIQHIVKTSPRQFPENEIRAEFDSQWSGFKIEAFGLLERKGAMFDYASISKAMFYQPELFCRQVDTPTRVGKAWSEEEEEAILIGYFEEAPNPEKLTIGNALCKRIVKEHGPQGTKSRTLVHRSENSIKHRMLDLNHTKYKSKQSRLAHKFQEWPSAKDQEYAAFKKQAIPSLLKDLKSGKTASGQPPMPGNFDVLTTVYRISVGMPAKGYEGFVKNASICRDVFCEDTNIDIGKLQSNEIVGLAPRVKSAFSWNDILDESRSLNAAAQRINDFMTHLQRIHDKVPEDERWSVAILVIGIDGLTTNYANAAYLQQRFPKLDMTLILMAGWRQIYDPGTKLLQHWWFPVSSRFAYGFYSLAELAQTAVQNQVHGPSAELLTIWGLVSSRKKSESSVEFHASLGITPKNRNDIGEDWLKWTLRKYQCGLCLFTGESPKDINGH